MIGPYHLTYLAVFRMKFYVFRKFYYLCTSIPAQSDIRRPGTYTGEMLEWLKRHAWKACIRQNRISGSNPDLSAPIGRSLLRPVLVSCLLKVYFHKGSRIQNHNVRRTSAYWSKGHPGEGRREEACAAWLIPISPQPTLKLKDLHLTVADISENALCAFSKSAPNSLLYSSCSLG